MALPPGENYFPCPICQGPLPVKTDRKGKPYVVCDHPCGVQMFIRRPEGVRRFRQLLARGCARNSLGLSRVLEFYDSMGSRREEIRKLLLLQGPDPLLEREAELVQSQRERVRKFLVRALREKRRELVDARGARSNE